MTVCSLTVHQALGSGGGGGVGGGFVSPEVHERETNRFLFRLHLFGTGREFTLRSESTGTLVTTFLLGVRFGGAVQVETS